MTPCLQTLSDGDLSSNSHFKNEHEATRTTEKELHEDDS